MPSLLTTGFLAFLLCLVFTPLLRYALDLSGQPARREASNRERDRDRAAVPALPSLAVPRLGGLAVLASAALALLLPHWLRWSFAPHLSSRLQIQFAAPVLIVFLVGAVDDWRQLSPRWKFAGQTVAALLAFTQGLRVHAVFHHPVGLGAAALLTVVWLVGCSNAFNLIDGLDGLATGLALFATGTVLAHAVLIGDPGLALIMGVLFGSLAAFLLFNFPPASMYLGDSGSLSIGFLLGCMALAWANKATTMVGLAAPLFALLVPVLDTAVAILRRGLTRQPLFVGDQGHIHHRLLRRGLAPRHAVFVLYAVAALGAIVSLLLADLQQRHTFELVILLFVVLAVVGVQQLGYVEFSELGRVFRRGLADPRRSLQAQVTLRHWGEEMTKATDYAQLWECLRQIAASLDFTGVEFRAGDFHRAEPAQPAAEQFCGWTCQIPLGSQGELGRVRYWRELSPAHPGFVDDLAEVLRAALVPQLQSLPIPLPAAKTRAASAS